MLIVFDVEMWCYHRRAMCLQKYAPSDLDITITSHAAAPAHNLREYAIVFVIDYACLPGWTHKAREAGTILVGSFNKDSRSRHKEWEAALRAADLLIVNNEDRYRANGIQPHTVCISNGVDLEAFRPMTPIGERPHKCLWTGGIGPAKLKGHAEVIEHLRGTLEQRGFTHSFRPITAIVPEQVYSQEKMVEWYNGASYWLCASGSEGTPNGLLEAMACGTVPITTVCGNVPELLEHDVNGLIVERDWQKFVAAIEYAREHRERLSAAAIESVQSWGYGPPGNRAAYFYALFRALIERGPKGVKPFSYRDVKPEEI